jgi:hypothetical protein
MTFSSAIPERANISLSFAVVGQGESARAGKVQRRLAAVGPELVRTF